MLLELAVNFQAMCISRHCVLCVGGEEEEEEEDMEGESTGVPSPPLLTGMTRPGTYVRTYVGVRCRVVSG